ncbi:bifunctional DNA primase/polymerase [Oerskovia jenensis]|uniref:bifunctional DNA primase/polymerase n=1 Tax=Oerskovia jenensis TaxID=162169 RepID=UPI0036DA8637
MIKQCARCGGDVRVAGVGRIPKYCGNACRQAAYRARRLPVELTSRPRWVRRDAAKRPLTTSGRPASSTSPATWRAYDRARDSRVGVGLGFVLGDGVGCIDLDHCLVDGVPLPWARQILRSLPPTYIEVSQSGEGLHIFGLLPPAPGRKIRDGVRSVEWYSTGRYIAVTADSFAGSVSTLADLTPVVGRLSS